MFTLVIDRTHFWINFYTTNLRRRIDLCCDFLAVWPVLQHTLHIARPTYTMMSETDWILIEFRFYKLGNVMFELVSPISSDVRWNTHILSVVFLLTALRFTWLCFSFKHFFLRARTHTHIGPLQYLLFISVKYRTNIICNRKQQQLHSNTVSITFFSFLFSFSTHHN